VLQRILQLLERTRGRTPFVLDDRQRLDHCLVRVWVTVGQLGSAPVHSTIVGLFDDP
jgi:hypothetical protein